MNYKIPLNEIEKNKLSAVDEVGFVFCWEDRIFRAIEKSAENHIHEIFNSGLVSKLIENNFIPKTWISEYFTDTHKLIIEHEKINPITYPHEWSFSMMKDASIFILKLNQFLLNYGYQLKDCHGYNVLFNKTDPVFVDFGSIIKINDKKNLFLCKNEFESFYYYPLKLWSRGSYYLSNSIINYSSIKLMTYDDYLFSTNFLFFKLKKIFNFYKKIMNKLLFIEKNYKKLISRIKKPKYNTYWKSYHDEFFDKNKNIIPDKDRFNQIIEIIKSLPDIKSIVEVGGNQGLLSQLITEKTLIKKIICSDYDEQAVDSMYSRIKNLPNKSITPAVINFVYPYINTFEISPSVRFKSDAILALALTHHLLITQKINIDYLMDILSSYTNKYVLVEFMPLGLWNGHDAPPVPYWYNEEYFIKHFERKFNLVKKQKLNKNRILFIGTKKI